MPASQTAISPIETYLKNLIEVWKKMERARTAARRFIKCTVGLPKEIEMAATAHLTLVVPDNEKFTVQSAAARSPRRKPNAEYRSREHLTEREVERLIEAVKGNR